MDLLRLASEDAWEAVIKQLDEASPEDLKMVDEEGDSVFTMACYAGDSSVVSMLMQNAAVESFINAANLKGFTGLMCACEQGHDDIVELLLEDSTLDVNVADNDGMTALMHATRNRHVAVVSSILQLSHVHVNSFDSSQTSAFVHACKAGDAALVDLFLKHPVVNFNQPDENGWTGFMHACNDGHKDVMLLLLVHLGVNINRTGLRGMSGFLLVCKNGDLDLICMLLDHPSVVVAQENEDDWTAADFVSRKLHCAAHGDPKENEHIVALIGRILDRGGTLKHAMSTVECRGECKGAVMNLAEWAHEKRWNDIATQLRRGYFGDINMPYRGGRLLDRCSKAGQHDLLALVLQQTNVQVDFVNYERHSALDLAVSHKHVECVKLLLAAGASTNHDNMSTLRHLRHGPKNLSAAVEIKQVVEVEEKRRKDFPLHCMLQFRQFDAFKDAVRAGQVPLDRSNINGQTVLMLAAEQGLVDTVRLLVQHGADLDIRQGDEDSEMLSQRGSTVSVKSLSTDHQPHREGDGRTALMYAASRGHREVVELLLDFLAEVDHIDRDGKTALMLAAEIGSEGVVRTLLAHEADVDMQQTAADADGIQNKTALAIAATEGHADVVEVLLENLADTDMVYVIDGVEYSVDELVKWKLLQNGTAPAVPSSLRANWRACLDLLKKEMTYRANSTVYVQKLRSKFQALTEDEPFDETLFRRAIKAEPSLGRLFLTDCLRVERHELSFSKLELIYGLGEDVQTSALHSLLHLDSDNPDFMFRAKQLLEHVVFRRILALKWEFFAQRLFIEQILSYVVVLISMSISVTLHSQSDVSMFPMEIGIFTITLAFAGVGFGVAQLLRPKPLWLLARLLHDGKFKFEPMLTIPNLSALKVRAKWCIVLLGVVGTLAVSIPLLVLVLPMIDKDSEGVVGWVVNGTLWLAVCYFLELEWREFQGDNGSFGAKASKYFKSNFNCAQVVAYMLVLAVYVPHELKLVAVVDDKLVLCLGCLLTLGLWILSLQYVAVFRTGGYLLPMMSGILQDVWNFATFFAVFQLGLTCVFYQLFHNNHDVSGYESFFHAFCTTFFVLFGQFKMETWDSDSVLMADPVIFAFSIVLVLFHACVVTVILMNVLLATVNKTVDRGLVTSKVEALWSYAECILRLEVTLDPDQQKTMAFIDVPPLGDLPNAYDMNEEAPLVPSSMMTSVRSNSWQYAGVLNPAFHEKVSKAELGAETLKATKDVEEHVKLWDDCVNDLEAATLEELETVMGLLHRTSHFTTSPYHEELGCLSDAIPKVMHVFMDAKKKRAPTAATKANRLHQLHKKVHRELMFLKTQLAKLPARPTAALFYQVVHGVRVHETLAKCVAAIQSHFDDVVDKLAMTQDQKVSDLSLQLHEANEQTTTHLESHSTALHEVDVKVQAILQVDQSMRDQQGETQAQLLLLQQHVAHQHQLLETMADTMASLTSTVRSLQRPRYARSAASRRRLREVVAKNA